MSAPNVPRLKLWYSPGACSFAPHALLLESGLSFQLILSQVGSFTDDFMSLNPKGRVPVLAMDEELVTEMPAILTAISQHVPDRHLLGKTPLETIRVYEWLNYLSGTVHGQGYGALWRLARYIEDPMLYAQVQQKGLETIKECYAYIEGKLIENKTTYLVGQSLTATDFFLFVIYRWGLRANINMKVEYLWMTAWADRLLEEKSVLGALKVHTNV
ncbi:hypothetical protein PV08_09967 [Exophiala spinifera]|uniref:GST C-terminal domain-containing protein n=1 Tax=Exophiala spinifera TaxID=91928 RepID=A0A0D2BNH7_9EURO|nr:uncharacterized protein PV08_09967 [Exophiala spinifera]KIW12689.1 hypothetical protein PV08_09967 [Exophiala spinifera]